MSRYHVSNSEGQYEEDSGEQVLAKKLGISRSDEIDDAELILLEQLYQFIFQQLYQHSKSHTDNRVISDVNYASSNSGQ